MSLVLEMPGPSEKPGPVLVEVTDSKELVIHNWDNEVDEAAAALGLTPSPVYLIDRFDDALRRAETPFARSVLVRELFKNVLQLRKPRYLYFLTDYEAADYMMELSRLGLVQILVELGANPKQPLGDFGDIRPLELMAANANLGAVKSLVEHGAEVTFNENAALQAAIPEKEDSLKNRKNTHMVVEYLLEHGADEGQLGWPLYSAVLSRDEILVDMLFRYGADPFWLEQLAFNSALDEGYQPIIDRFMREFELYKKKGYVRTEFPERER